MRIVVGALLGLVLASAAVAFLGIALGSKAYFAALVGGVIAGIVMRQLGDRSPATYTKGAVAALVAGLAAVAGPLASAQWLRTQGATTTELTGAAVVANADEEDGEADATGTPAVEAAAPLPGLTSGGSAPLRPPVDSPLPTADIASLVIGCLAAYQLGKGKLAAVEGDPADPEAAADPPAEST